jgi:hypothetical protein
VELAHDKEHGLEPHIPDMDFESEACYQWQENMLDDDLRRSWEEEADKTRERKELKRERVMKKNRWKIIVEKAIDFATTGPATDFNFERCRPQSC